MALGISSSLEYRTAVPSDAAQCVELRGKTRENAVSPSKLAALGITIESWSDSIRTDVLPGVVCESSGQMVGYCFGDRKSGEVVVLALLPEFECQGIGRTLLDQIIKELTLAGHSKLFLGCSADASSRSYGFYRHLGWVSTHAYDENGDEILEYRLAKPVLGKK